MTNLVMRVDAEKYFQQVQKEHCPEVGIRYGQALFNALASTNPDMASEIAGTDLDPFHAKPNSVTINLFISHICLKSNIQSVVDGWIKNSQEAANET